MVRISIFGFRIVPGCLGSKATGRGFTLLELLVVLVIMGLASGLVVPRLIGSLSNTALLTAGKQITASLRWARSAAVSRRTMMTAVFHIPENRMEFKRPAGDGDGREPAGAANSSGLHQPPPVFDLPRNVSLEMGVTPGGEMVKEEFRILFHPAGNSSGGEIVLHNDRGRRLKIVVDFITGTAQLLEIAPS